MKYNSALAKIIFFFSALTLPAIGMSQTSKPGLLWRISGNGLEQPSYLFGTIHLTDKRVFNFGDSLYAAIENCSGYAMELHPDSMMTYFFAQEKNKKPSRLLKDVVSKNLFNSAKTKLQKEFGKSPDKITVGDLHTYFNDWMFMPKKDGKMETFMDAYLYNVVRKQGKWVG